MISSAAQIRLAPMTLLGGIACGVGTVAVYQWTWALVLAAAVGVLTLVAAPPGWGTRLPFALGHALIVAATSVPRSQGGYLVGATAGGYAVLVISLMLMAFAVATLPRPGRRRTVDGTVDTRDGDASSAGRE